jgi:hypothetical protein
VAFTAVWLSKVDPPEFVRAQAEQSARFTNLPPDQQETVVASQAKFFPPIAWVTAFVGAPILVSVVVLALVFVFRFVLADETTIRQGYAVVSWSYFAIALVQLPLILVTLFLKGEWRISPQEAFLASPALLLDKNAASKALFAFLGSLDVFSFWSILLISWGFAAAGRRRFGAAFWGVLVPWLVYVIAKVFLVALNS